MRTAGSLYRVLRTHNHACCELYGNHNAVWNTAVLNSHQCDDCSFFVGLQGAARNGGQFAEQSVQAGARVALVEHAYNTPALRTAVDACDGAVLFVNNALSALTALAHAARMKSAATFIGITGSTGKTTTKELLRAITHGAGNRGNYNTVQGLSISVLNADLRMDYAVFECGISEEHEMDALTDVLLPHQAVITNVGVAHAGFFASLERIRDEKLRIAARDTTDILWLLEEDTELSHAARGAVRCTIRTHGYASCAGFVRVDDKGIDGSIIRFTDGDVRFPMPGAVNARNAITALCVADELGIPREQSFRELESFAGVTGRYHVVSKNPLIIDDSYNASTPAMEHAVSWFVNTTRPPRLAILGGMKELGEYGADEHQKVVDVVVNALPSISSAAGGAITVLLVGNEYAGVSIPRAYKNIIASVETVARAKEYIQKTLNDSGRARNFSVLLKGSNAYKLSELAQDIRAAAAPAAVPS